MKIKNLIFLILVISLIVNIAIILVFTQTKVKDIGSAVAATGTDELKTTSGEGLQNIAVGIRNSLDNQMKNQYNLVKSWAKSPVIYDTAAAGKEKTLEQLYEMWSAAATRSYADDTRANGDGNFENDLNPKASKYLAEMSKLTDNYPEIFFTDSRGYAVGANVATGDFDQGPDDYVIALEAGKANLRKWKPNTLGEGWYEQTNKAPDGFYVTEVVYDESSRTWGLELDTQIKDPVTNANIGVMKAVFDYSKFIQRFVNVNDLDVYKIEVLTKEGVIVATSDTDKSKVNNVNLSNTKFFQEIKSGKTAGFVVSDKDEDGADVMISYAVSTDVNKHIIIVTQKSSDVMIPINSFIAREQQGIGKVESELITDIILVALLVGVLTLIVAFVVISTKISKPIGQLSDVSKKISRGEIAGLKLDVHGDDEIGRLGESFQGVLAAFNQMNDELGKSGKK
jgi:hypothetical protein